MSKNHAPVATRIAPELETVAFIAIGAAKAHTAASWPQRERAMEAAGGYIAYVGDIVKHAITLDRMADAVGDFAGVFAYEVAEEFGYLYGKAVIECADESPETIMGQLIEGAKA